MRRARRGIAPGYEQKAVAPGDLDGRVRLVASPDGRDGSVTIHADAGRFDAGKAGVLPIRAGRHALVHVARGEARVNGHALKAGDAAAMSDIAEVHIEGVDNSEVLVFDLA